MPENFLTDLVGISKPATMLIEKVSNAFGRHFDPNQTRRMAIAEADSRRILAVSEAKTEIEVTELRMRAADRVVNEEMTKQKNIESITKKAIPHLKGDASPEHIEDDWITNFFDRCRIVSDEQMQDLWARVLAGQGNNPGSFSRKTVNLVADLDRRGAELFTSLCRYIWVVGDEAVPLVYDTNHEIYNQRGINFRSIGQLETLGLVHFSGVAQFETTNLPKRVTATYSNIPLTLTLPNDVGNKLDIGKVMLTQPGFELIRVVNANTVEGFFDYVYNRWENGSLLPPRRAQTN